MKIASFISWRRRFFYIFCLPYFSKFTKIIWSPSSSVLSVYSVHYVPAMLHMFESFNQILIHYSIIWKREFQVFLFSRLFFTLAVLTKFFRLMRTCVDIQMVSIKWKLLQYIINRFIPLAPYPLLIPLIIMNV